MTSWFGAAGRATVPQNRWDLLPVPAEPPKVSVVVPWFRQQVELERLLAGIELQEGRARICEVVVADDGSPEPPVVPPSYTGPPVVVVRQPKRGIRPGAARNLGAASATGDVLAFLDADMVPSPGYVAAVAELPAVAPEAVVVGTRQHWDLAGWSAARTTAWLRGGAEPRRLSDPAWLSDGYRRSRDLLDLDRRSYQLVIGAVTTVHRSLFSELGGFDEEIDAYGAEDWDLAFRAVQAGALLAHVDAVAHHDGPDWRGRVGPEGVKNDERLHLVRRIPSRSDPLLGSPPYVRVTLHAAGAGTDACVACVASVLAATGLSASIGVVGVSEPCPSVLAADPRVRWGEPPVATDPSVIDVLLPTPVLVAVAAVDLLSDALEPGGPGRVVVADDLGVLLVAEEARARRRVDRWSGHHRAPTWEDLFGRPHRWEPAMIGAERVPATVDLAEVLLR